MLNAYQVEIVDYHQVKQVAKLKNIHPGDILLHEFLEPMGISQNKLARDISVPPRRINEIVLGKRAITTDTALRLARYFDSSEKFWLGLQDDYDMEADSILNHVMTGLDDIKHGRMSENSILDIADEPGVS